MNLFGCNSVRCLCHSDDRAPIRLAATAYVSLSPEEQCRVNQDLYNGSGDNEVAETPEFVDRSLAELDGALALLSEESKKYYNKAIAIEQRLLQQVGSEEYIGSKQFRLQFLRADIFDARLAARRLTEYFQHKYELFGEEKLACKIRQSDLNDIEKKALVSGVLTFTGGTDFCGRPVVIARRSNMFYFSITCIKRMFFYLYQKVVDENETAQKKGTLVVFYHMNMGTRADHPTKLRAYYPAVRMVKHGLPVRLAAAHVYYDDLTDHFLLNFALVLFGRRERARLLTHFEHSPQACLMNAMTFGINPDQLPFTKEGNFQYELISSYWERQRQLEE